MESKTLSKDRPVTKQDCIKFMETVSKLEKRPEIDAASGNLIMPTEELKQEQTRLLKAYLASSTLPYVSIGSGGDWADFPKHHPNEKRSFNSPPENGHLIEWEKHLFDAASRMSNDDLKKLINPEGLRRQVDFDFEHEPEDAKARFLGQLSCKKVNELDKETQGKIHRFMSPFFHRNKVTDKDYSNFIKEVSGLPEKPSVDEKTGNLVMPTIHLLHTQNKLLRNYIGNPARKSAALDKLLLDGAFKIHFGHLDTALNSADKDMALKLAEIAPKEAIDSDTIRKAIILQETGHKFPSITNPKGTKILTVLTKKAKLKDLVQNSGEFYEKPYQGYKLLGPNKIVLDEIKAHKEAERSEYEEEIRGTKHSARTLYADIEKKRRSQPIERGV
jgi:hypothetical protein